MARLILTVLLVSAATSAWGAPGIVIYDIMQFGHVVLKAGSIVDFTEVPCTGFHVRFQGNEYDTSGGVIPLDPEFAPSRIYLQIQSPRLLNVDQDIQVLQALVDLAEAALKHFGHTLAVEQIEAQNVRLTYQLISCQTEGKTTAKDAITKARRYIAHYPQGKYVDEFQWKAVLWSNEVYETEGDASIPLGQARAYETFRTAHPNSTYAEEIQMRSADRYRLGADFLDFGPDAKKPGPGIPYRKRAERLYLALLESKDPVRSAGARVALFNLKHGRVSAFATPTSPPMDW